MSSRSSLTATALIDTLLADGTITAADLVSLLGEKRGTPQVNSLEIALVRESVMSKEELLDLVARVSGQPVFVPGTFALTAHLDATVAAKAGALILARNPLTVIMVEDTQTNLDTVATAIRTTEFEVWLTTAPAFRELLLVAYREGALDDRPHAPDLFTILDVAIKERSSDIHLKVGVPPRIRVDGSMTNLNFQPLSQLWMTTQADKLTATRHQANLTEKFSADLAYTYGTSRFRVNIAHDNDGMTMVLRKLPSAIPTFDDLGAPGAIRRFAELERGMVLVTGPTGSGKSTTLAALLNHIITSSARHVITLEDPIEFRFPTQSSSLVNQRELGSSFSSFTHGLRDALRQDPDVILVGEMRDTETIKAALTAAETGHLVFGTLHTVNAAQTVSRIVNSFGAEEQDAIRAQLSQMLKGVVSQTLLPKATTKGRVAAYEIMVTNPAIATNLRKVDGANQIKQTMQTGTKEGMCLIEASLADLVHRGLVSQEEAQFRAQDELEFLRQLDFLERGETS